MAEGRILAVDDARSNLLLLDSRLRDAGYDVTVARDGGVALELLGLTGEAAPAGNGSGPPFDLIVLDIMMPEVDGLEVLRRLREVYSKIAFPVIMATAKDRSSDVVDALRAGANDYVTKPIDMPGLLARIRTHIDLRDSHRALKEAQRSLIDSARIESIGHLAAGVAHEIRNPLGKIRMAVHGLKDERTSKTDQDKLLLSIIEDAVERSDAIVRSLMDFSASVRLDLKPGDIAALVEETLDLLRDDLAGAGITVEVSDSGEVGTVLFARNELRQVLISLVLNAVQAMEKGGELTVRMGLREVDGISRDEGSRSGIHMRNGDTACAIEIIDSGTGIPKEHLDSIFDAFFTTRATGSGTGLGLTVARKVVELHGGHMIVENRENRSGVRVTLLLPLAGALATTV